MLNASLISDLVLLGASEAGPLIQRVYAAGRVDKDDAGSLETVLEDLGVDGGGSVICPIGEYLDLVARRRPFPIARTGDEGVRMHSFSRRGIKAHVRPGGQTWYN